MIILTIGGQSVELLRYRELLGLRLRSEDFALRIFDHGEWKIVARGLGGFDLMAADGDADAGKALDALRCRPEVLCATHVYRIANSSVPLVPTGDLYLVFREDASHNACLAFMDSFFLKIKEIRGKNSIVAQVTALSPNPVQVALLAKDRTDLVDVCEPDLAFPLRWMEGAVSSDIPKGHSHPLHNEAGSPDSTLPHTQAAREAVGLNGTYRPTIAVLDDGFDLTHPDLRNILHAPNDFVHLSARSSESSAENVLGTNIARLALAHGPSGDVRFLPVRATWLCDSLFEKICDCLIENGADVLNCSWDFPDGIVSARIRHAIARLAVEGRRGRGTVAVFAASDVSNHISRSVALPEVLSVGGWSEKDTGGRSLRFGTEISLVAPVSNWGDGNAPRCSQAAAPMVAGAVALVLSANPDLTAQEVKQLLQSTADRIGPLDAYDADGFSDRFGHGLLNIQRAVVKARGTMGLGRCPFVDKPPILPRAAAQGALSAENPTKLYRFSFGNQLIVQAETRRAGLDLGLFLRKEEVPRPSIRAFDKLGRFQNGSVVLVQNDIAPTDQYLLVRAEAHQGPYALQISLAGSDKHTPQAETDALRRCLQLKFQFAAQAELTRPGETHLYRLSLAPRLLARLRVRPTANGSIGLYFRRGDLPDPIGACFDAVATASAQNESGPLELEFEAPAFSDGFFLVRATEGFEGDFEIEVQLGL